MVNGRGHDGPLLIFLDFLNELLGEIRSIYPGQHAIALQRNVATISGDRIRSNRGPSKSISSGNRDEHGVSDDSLQYRDRLTGSLGGLRQSQGEVGRRRIDTDQPVIGRGSTSWNGHGRRNRSRSARAIDVVLHVLVGHFPLPLGLLQKSSFP